VEAARMKLRLSQKVTALLVYGRPPLVFAGLLCAVGVMWTRSPTLYMMGVLFLFTSMSFDLFDGWFAARFQFHAVMAHLADRIMDRVVYSIIFPLVAVGMMWRLQFITPGPKRGELLHAIFILLLCITVLIRDNFTHFIRIYAMRQGQEPEPSEFTRLRTAVAAPVAAFLYAYAFYIPEGLAIPLYAWISWPGTLPLRWMFYIEIIFLIINFGSIAAYCRKYGGYCLDELCLGDYQLRRRMLSVFPNALTVMNAMMGILAVFFAYQGNVREAFLILMGAVFFDKLDGALARKLGLTEPAPGMEVKRVNLGNIMDDLADTISFCIVPAWIFHITLTGLAEPFVRGLPLLAIVVFYAVMGMARLVYFTLDPSPIPGFFKGLPTPAAALTVTAPLVMLTQAAQESPEWVRFWVVFCFVLMILIAFLMNTYPIHYLHIGRFMDRRPWFTRFTMLVLLVFLFTPFFGHVVFLCLIVYLFSPLWTWRSRPPLPPREPGGKA
jgi:CDP-diacylglycerol---serine O-phosphatidyltransferase